MRGFTSAAPVSEATGRCGPAERALVATGSAVGRPVPLAKADEEEDEDEDEDPSPKTAAGTLAPGSALRGPSPRIGSA